MIKNLLFAITLTVTINSFAGDTTNIQVHDHTDMTWNGNYDEWGVFPDGSKTYRKIYLHYTMGCASSGCSDWDYTTKIEVLHRTGQLDTSLNEIIESYELARVITPYGNVLNNNWEFTHIFDITDFASILQDSVEIRAHYGGWSSGFSATLDFEFIEGTPPRNVTSLQNIYSGGCSYTTSSAFEQSCLPPKMFWVDANSTQAMVKMTTTGHGFDNNIYAAEFKPIDYYVKIDGNLTHTQFNWDPNCGENPIYPQGGTWILDRANWCPGTRAQTFDHEITNYITSSDSVEINVDFQSYSWSGTQTPSYIIDCQLFLYEGSNFTNDVEITDIIKPSLKDEYSRFNPICGKPLIKIRNYGSDPLTSVVIEYGVEGGIIHTYTWNGSLAFMEEEEVELPLLQNWGGTKDVFQVSLSNPNGQSDEYLDNNIMGTPFAHVPQYEEKFAVWTQTNSGGGNVSETSWKFLNDDGSLYNISQTMYINTQYRDTIEFESGCYTFIVEDTDEDGLDYWNNSDGVGYVKLRNVPGTWFSDFNADFGTNIIHNFRVGTILSSENIFDKLDVFPNPATDNIRLESAFLINSEIKILNLLGEEIYSKTANSNSESISISAFPNGIYTIQVQENNTSIIQKFVKQ